MFCCVHLVAQPRDGALNWSAVLDWLPTDTQTLIVARQPFVIPKHDPDAVAEPSPVDFLRRLVLGRLDEFPMLYQAIAGRTIRFALAGVSEFRRFSGLGLVPYDGCAVMVFSEPLGASLHSAILGQPKEDWSGATIFLFSTAREGSLRSSLEQSNLFVAQLGSNVLIVATDRSLLHSLLERQAGSQAGRALPSVLLEWKDVRVTAAVWAMRHYKRTYDRKTKMPVLSTGPLEELDDSEAVGVVYNA